MAGPSSASPLEQTTSANVENPPDVPMTSIYPTFQTDPSEMVYSIRRTSPKVCRTHVRSFESQLVDRQEFH